MNNIYIKSPNLNKIGFFNGNYNDFLRMKQGLMPQNLSSDCYSPPDWTSYEVPVNVNYMCNGNNMSPIKLPYPDYESEYPSDNCECTRYVKTA